MFFSQGLAAIRTQDGAVHSYWPGPPDYRKTGNGSGRIG